MKQGRSIFDRKTIITVRRYALIVLMCTVGSLDALEAEPQSFTIRNFNQRPLLQTPDGNPFFSLGMVHIRQGTRQPLFKERFNRSESLYMKEVSEHLQEIGFNTAGYGCVYQKNTAMSQYMPFIADIMFCWNSLWAGKAFSYVDVWDPLTETQFLEIARKHCQPISSNKNLIGYMATDIPFWRHDIRRNPLEKTWVDSYRSPNTSIEGKSKYIEFLQTRYEAFQTFEQIYNTNTNSWIALKEQYTFNPNLSNENLINDDLEFTRLIAKKYYKMVHDSIRAWDKTHLIFGDRYFPSHYLNEVVQEALPYIDAITIQPNKIIDFDWLEKVHHDTGKAILLCDYAINHKNPDYPKYLWQTKATELEASQTWNSVLNNILKHNFIIGIHRCTYIDLPKNDHTFKQGIIRRNGTPYETQCEQFKKNNVLFLQKILNV